MSHRSFRLTFAAVLLTVTSVLAACSSSKAPDAPLSSAGGSTAASHPEWSQYTFTIGDNGGDGSEELSKVTGAFDDAPYKVKFARFDYGPPLVQADRVRRHRPRLCRRRPADHRRGKAIRLQDRRRPARRRPDQGRREHHRAEGIADPDAGRPQGQEARHPAGQLGPRPGAARAQERGPDTQGRRSWSTSARRRAPRRSTPARWTPGRSGTRRRRSRSRTAPGSSPRAFRRSTRSTTTTWRPTNRSATRTAGPPSRTFSLASRGSSTGPSRIPTNTPRPSRRRRVSPWRTPGRPWTRTRSRSPRCCREDVKAQQALSDAFFEAGEITKKVDITTITDNLLPGRLRQLEAVMSAARTGTAPQRVPHGGGPP